MADTWIRLTLPKANVFYKGILTKMQEYCVGGSANVATATDSTSCGTNLIANSYFSDFYPRKLINKQFSDGSLAVKM